MAHAVQTTVSRCIIDFGPRDWSDLLEALHGDYGDITELDLTFGELHSGCDVACFYVRHGL